MPWFVVDDNAHSHPKMIAAGNAALGLWLRCGAYAAQHLTDGIVPGVIAKMYGSKPQITRLVAAGLWHEHGHTCPHPKCAQPQPGDFYIHDYLAPYNPSRAEVELKRERAAEKKRRQRAHTDPAPPRPPKIHARIDDESRANRERIEDESHTIHRPVSEEHAGREGVSPGDSLGTRARAFPSPPLPSKEVAEVRERSTGSGARGGAALSLITPNWQPTAADHTAAAADIRRLGPTGTTAATAKFVRHHTAKQTTAADFGPLWVSWLARERPDSPTQGTFLVGLPGGGGGPSTPTPPTFAQRMAELDARAEADRVRDRHAGETG